MTVAKIAKIVLVMLLWAVCFPLISIGIEEAPHLSFAALRAILAGLTLTILAFAYRRPLPRGARTWAIVSAIGVGATSLGFLGMFHAAEFISPGMATVIANTQPLLAAALAVAVLDERLAARGKIGMAFGFGGILVITSPELFSANQSDYLLGVAYITLAALGITASNVLIKRLAGNVDGLMTMGFQMLIGGIPLMLAAAIMEEPGSIRWSFTFVWALIALALPGTALVYWLWFSVLETTPLNWANAFSFLIPVFGLTMGIMFYGETLGWVQILGIMLTVFGVWLVTYRARDSGRSST